MLSSMLQLLLFWLVTMTFEGMACMVFPLKFATLVRLTLLLS